MSILPPCETVVWGEAPPPRHVVKVSFGKVPPPHTQSSQVVSESSPPPSTFFSSRVQRFVLFSISDFSLTLSFLNFLCSSNNFIKRLSRSFLILKSWFSNFGGFLSPSKCDFLSFVSIFTSCINSSIFAWRIGELCPTRLFAVENTSPRSPKAFVEESCGKNSLIKFVGFEENPSFCTVFCKVFSIFSFCSGLPSLIISWSFLILFTEGKHLFFTEDRPSLCQSSSIASNSDRGYNGVCENCGP